MGQRVREGFVALVLMAVAAACTPRVASSPTPNPARYSADADPTPDMIAAMPDTIPCDSAVLVTAGNSQQGSGLSAAG